MLKVSLGGPGCFSIAFALSTAGLIFVPAMMAMMAACVYNMLLLVCVRQRLAACPAHAAVRTYGDITAVVYGAHGRLLVDIFVAVQQLGICTVYFCFVSESARTLVADVGARHMLPASEGHAQALTIALLIVPIGLLAQIRHQKSLAPIAPIANALMFAGILIAMSRVAADLMATGVHAVPVANPAAVPLLFGQVIYSYECMCSVLPVENALADGRDMPAVLGVSQACPRPHSSPPNPRALLEGPHPVPPRSPRRPSTRAPFCSSVRCPFLRTALSGRARSSMRSRQRTRARRNWWP